MEYRDLGDLFGESGGFSDFFRDIFGGMGGASQGQPRGNWRGQDLEHTLEVTLREAYEGTTRVLQLESQRIEVKIPPGVESGSRIRIAGKGVTGTGRGAGGDLYLHVSVLPDGAFERKGSDLYGEVPVDVYTAVLGGEVPVRTPSGQVMLTIPPETQGGKRFRLQGLGMPNLKKPETRGDMYAEVRLVLPKQLNEQERKLFSELASLRGQ